MKGLTFADINKHLQSLKSIYQALDVPKNKVKELDQAIHLFNEYGDTSVTDAIHIKGVPRKSKKKLSFTEVLERIDQGKHEDLEGTKINYETMNSSQHISEFFEQTTKPKVLRETTALDLKLLYSLLTGNPEEIKGTKSKVYDDIKGYVRAKKRGMAFSRGAGHAPKYVE